MWVFLQEDEALNLRPPCPPRKCFARPRTEGPLAMADDEERVHSQPLFPLTIGASSGGREVGKLEKEGMWVL